METAESLLTPKEVASLLKVRPSTVYEWVRNGRIPHLRVAGRSIRFEVRKLEAWMKESAH